jgi:asparagine synthase (glutamine-hydrolysing)
MANSIEGRTPFLDHHLFEFARNIPPELNIRHGIEKYIVRRLARGLVPDPIVERRRWPFATSADTIAATSHGAAHLTLSKYLSREAIECTGLFDRQVVSLLGSMRNIAPLRGAADSALFYLCCMQILRNCSPSAA